MLDPASSSSETTSVLPQPFAAIISAQFPSCVMNDMCSETLNHFTEGSSHNRQPLHV